MNETSFGERLLSDGAGHRDQILRFAAATGLASTFGIALGVRGGPLSVLHHALGVTLGMLGVCGLAVPALAIVLMLADAKIDALGLVRATSRAAAHAGLLLAGLAPGVALFSLTVEDAITVSIVGAGGLLLAGWIGARSFRRDLAPTLGEGVLGRLAVPSFIVFAAVLGARIWWMSLPLLRGG